MMRTIDRREEKEEKRCGRCGGGAGQTDVIDDAMTDITIDWITPLLTHILTSG